MSVELASLYVNLPAIVGIKAKILLTDSKPYSDGCQIKARNDVEALNAWLTQHNENKHTMLAYSREGKRFLLWCMYERGLSFNQLKVEDFELYFNFLKNPPARWRTTRTELSSNKDLNCWRPFVGPLNQAAFNMGVRVINSLLTYLVDADYLRSNPLKLIKKHTKFSLDLESQKYKVKARMLEADEWAAVQQALDTMPEANIDEIDNKMRTQFLFAMLYLLGLRIHEVQLSSWNAFRQMDSNWWFFIKGKGGKLGHIPVNDQLLQFVKSYRLHLGKNPLPGIDETENILISKRTHKPLQQRQLYGLVKAIGIIAAQKFTDNPRKKQKLEQLSPHWLRHLSASHQDKLGIPATVIQANHRHSSSQTTQIYLHAEDTFRATEMEKLGMAIIPRIITPKLETKATAITLTIKGSPLTQSYNLTRLLDSIESSVLRGIAWASTEISRDELLARYKKLQIYKQPLIISYQLNNVEKDMLGYIKMAIMREADIRLFGCNIDCESI